MAPVLTAEYVVRRIAAECAYVDERGGVGIRLEPAAAIHGRRTFQRPSSHRQTCALRHQAEPAELMASVACGGRVKVCAG